MICLTKKDLSKLSNIKQIYFAIFCAEQVFHLVEEKDKDICRVAIDTAIAYVEGRATKEDCRTATYAAANAANAANAAYAAAAADAAAYAAYAAAAATDAADAAAYAAYANNKQAIIEAQWVYYDELLNGDKYFEEIVLKV